MNNANLKNLIFLYSLQNKKKSDIFKMSLFSSIKDRVLNQKTSRGFKALGINPFGIIGAEECHGSTNIVGQTYTS